MTSIETLAFILAVFASIKVLALIFIPELWVGLTDKLSRSSAILTFFYLIIAVISGFFVLNAFTIIQIGAVALFITALVGLSVAPHYDEFVEVGEKLVNEGTIYNSWLGLLAFLLIAIWIFFELFI